MYGHFFGGILSILANFHFTVNKIPTELVEWVDYSENTAGELIRAQDLKSCLSYMYVYGIACFQAEFYSVKCLWLSGCVLTIYFTAAEWCYLVKN